MTTAEAQTAGPMFSYRTFRYVPNLVRDEWINIGVLVFDERTGERRLRLIAEPEEFRRVRRLHPQADERVLRQLRDELENRLEGASQLFSGNGQDAAGGNGRADWLKLLDKWDTVLSNVLQLGPSKGTEATDLDAELERLYADQVAPQTGETPRVGQPGSRAVLRAHCSQVWRTARLWERIEKAVRVEEFTFPGDPMRIDYAYRRNGTRGFVQTLSVSRAPGDVKSLAYTVERIRARVPSSEFTAVTDIHLVAENARQKFVQETLRDAGIEAVAVDGFAVRVAKLKPHIQ